MPTLGQFLETQHQGIRQNPYKYKVVDIYYLYDVASNDDNSDIKVKAARDGILYRTVESIPKELYNRHIYLVEPCIMEHGCLCLRIVII